MEKLRAALEVLNKYHFWILCGLIVALSFGSWYWAIANEEKDYGDRQKAIDGTCSLVDKITKNNEHPSPDYIKEIKNRESGTLNSQVANASTRLYHEMRAANPLPQLFADPKDQAGFEAAFDKIWAPMEDIEKLPPNKQLDDLYRQRY